MDKSVLNDWYKNGKPSSFIEPKSIVDMPKFLLTIVKLKLCRAQKVLDIGCFTGYLGKNLDIEYHGVDLQKDLMEYLGGNFKFAPAENLPYKDEEFDATILLDVLEHCIDDKKAISEAERVTKKGGVIIINLPRDFEYPELYESDVENGEHLRVYTDSDIKRIFGRKKNFCQEPCVDEDGRRTSFITYEV